MDIKTDGIFFFRVLSGFQEGHVRVNAFIHRFCNECEGNGMQQEAILHRISTLLSRFQEEVKIVNANGEFSINIHAENVLLKILNVAYDLDLRNVNYEEGKTFAAIDLRDEARKVAVQVTSSGTVDKVVHTLEECAKKGYDEQVYLSLD